MKRKFETLQKMHQSLWEMTKKLIENKQTVWNLVLEKLIDFLELCPLPLKRGNVGRQAGPLPDCSQQPGLHLLQFFFQNLQATILLPSLLHQAPDLKSTQFELRCAAENKTITNQEHEKEQFEIPLFPRVSASSFPGSCSSSPSLHSTLLPEVQWVKNHTSATWMLSDLFQIHTAHLPNHLRTESCGQGTQRPLRRVMLAVVEQPRWLQIGMDRVK